MNLHIGTFCSHVWNLCTYLDMGDYDAAQAEQQGLHDWWDRTQDEIEGFVHDLTGPLRRDVDELLVWANEFYLWTTDAIDNHNARLNSLEDSLYDYLYSNRDNWLTNLLNYIYPGLGDLLSDPLGWLVRLLDSAYHGLGDLLSDPIFWLVRMLDSIVPGLGNLLRDPTGWLHWLLNQTFIGCQDLWDDLQGTWEWLKSWVRWAVEWLDWASDRLEWVLTNTLDMLYQLLVSPLEYVAGQLYHSFLFWYDVWLIASANLGYFVQVVLADLLTLWDMYKTQLKLFLTNPQAWIVANVEDVLVTWVFRVLAERW